MEVKNLVVRHEHGADAKVEKCCCFQRLRSLHGCDPLTYDVKLAKQAQKHAEYLIKMNKIEHSKNGDYGENIALKGGTPGFQFTGYDAARMWYSEIKDYNFKGEDQYKCGHFTQLVWSDTKRAGFGMAKSSKGDKVIIVGQYQPPGNYTGEFKTKVPRPKSGKVRIPEVSELSVNAVHRPHKMSFFEEFNKECIAAHNKHLKPLWVDQRISGTVKAQKLPTPTLSGRAIMFRSLYRVRALHGCRPLTYDPELAKQAQKHAEFLALKRRMVHSMAFDYGENIAKKFGTPGFKLTGPEATRLWYSEVEDYDFSGSDQINCGKTTFYTLF
ncbi:unnamed protein product [Hydatigera taeniaeformis]|uniref:SCP domain-containing protein n=1 Tax=Hydatigena taeniaeformis TaxID=6205 RepID=A0A0R3WL86_HYDTA|nr:unnamed protein product [Hydatigera taeniaeformis]